MSKLNPLVKKWVVTLTKSGENCDSDLLKKAIDLKVAMDEVESKLKPFKAVIKQKRVISDSEAYRDEVIVKAEDHLLGINFYPAVNQPSTSKGTGNRSLQSYKFVILH